MTCQMTCQMRCKTGNFCKNFSTRILNGKRVCFMHFQMLERNKKKNDVTKKIIKIEKYSERILFLENELLLEKYKNEELRIKTKELTQQLANVGNEFTEHKERMVKNLLDLSLSV